MDDARQVRQAAERYSRTLKELAACRAQNERLRERLSRVESWPAPVAQPTETPDFWDDRRGPMPAHLVGLPEDEVDAWLYFYELWYG